MRNDVDLTGYFDLIESLEKKPEINVFDYEEEIKEAGFILPYEIYENLFADIKDVVDDLSHKMLKDVDKGTQYHREDILEMEKDLLESIRRQLSRYDIEPRQDTSADKAYKNWYAKKNGKEEPYKYYKDSNNDY